MVGLVGSCGSGVGETDQGGGWQCLTSLVGPGRAR